jgi:rSAM/selenodomain-associated transferase 1
MDARCDRPALVVMAKEPSPQVKTRLGDVLSAEERAHLYEAFLADRIDQVAAVAGVIPILAFTPRGAEGTFAALGAGRVRLIAQPEGDLTARLSGLSGDLFGAGFPGVLFVDSDSPTLPVDSLAEAAAALATNEVVLGPAQDGGYYLLGTRAHRPSLFEGIEWSGPRVLTQTVAAARRLGLRIHFLASWYDVDIAADLTRLARELAGIPEARPGFPRRTAERVRRLCRLDLPARGEVLSLRQIYEDRSLRVEERIAEREGGALIVSSSVSVAPVVGVLPLLPGGRVRLWGGQIPTIAVGDGEAPGEAAGRALAEAYGVTAAHLRRLATLRTESGVAHLYAAEIAADAAGTGLPFEKALQGVVHGEITDALSALAILLHAQGT